jgi:hypothetical protein
MFFGKARHVLSSLVRKKCLYCLQSHMRASKSNHVVRLGRQDNLRPVMYYLKHMLQDMDETRFGIRPPSWTGFDSLWNDMNIGIFMIHGDIMGYVELQKTCWCLRRSTHSIDDEKSSDFCVPSSQTQVSWPLNWEQRRVENVGKGWEEHSPSWVNK